MITIKSGKLLQRFCLFCASFSVALTVTQSYASNTEFWFPPSLISDDGQALADLSQFEKGGQLPGAYQVEIWLNNESFAVRDLVFNEAGSAEDAQYSRDDTGLIPCLNSDILLEIGVRPDILQAEDSQQCLPLGRLIPHAETHFEFEKMRLNISIPQVSLRQQPRGWIAPERWNEGITAAMLNYNFSGGESRGRYGDSQNYFLRLNSGLNIGPWRFRDDRSWSESSSRHYNQRSWQHGSTYAERAIIPWRSRLILGDATTNGEVFDSVGLRGVELMTEDSMYPESQRGFAPMIRGSATSNARVTIRQNGYEVYRMNVAPGDFVINDLFPMYASGDLEVTVTEADGTQHTFTVPYSAVPLLLREGRIKYSVTAGKLRSISNRYNDPSFVQSTVIWGLPRGVTAYGGLQYADNYRAGTLGTGFNLGQWGAISADITQAYSTLTDDSQHQGKSLRFLYGRSLNEYGTTFQLTGWRYSTQGFYTLTETALKGMSGWQYDPDERDADGRLIPRPVRDYYNLYDNKKQRLQANISQRIGTLGSLYLTGSRQTFWNRRDTSESLQAGFNSSIGPVNYNVSLNQSKTAGMTQTDRTVFIGLSMPLGGSASPVFATLNGSRDGNGHIQQQAGLSGTLLEQRNLNWSVTQGYSRQAGGSGNASLGYQGTYGNANLGYSYSDNYQQTSYGVSGGLLLHRNGLTLSQPLGDTNVLIAAPGAAGVPLENSGGIKTDWRGYAVRPFAISYRENRVALDGSHLNDRTEMDDGVSRVVPTRGAVVRADFAVRSGLRVLMTLKHHGKPLPFGTVVSVGDSSSIVADDGQVFLSGLENKGTLQARWGSGADKQCSVAYRINEEAAKSVLIQQEAECR